MFTRVQKQRKRVNHHTGGLETLKRWKMLFSAVNHHTGGLEMYKKQGEFCAEVNHHTGGLEILSSASFGSNIC